MIDNKLFQPAFRFLKGEVRTKNLFLFHGLFASPAFYLPYINFARRFGNIYLFDVDYHEILMRPGVSGFRDYAKYIFSLDIPSPDIITLHSLSGLLGPFFPCKSNVVHYVCPPFWSNLDFQKFMSIAKVGPSDEFLLKKAIAAYQYFIVSEYISGRENVYLPDNDLVFNYDIRDGFSVNYFQGSHFCLENYFDLYFKC